VPDIFKQICIFLTDFHNSSSIGSQIHTSRRTDRQTDRQAERQTGTRQS